ncbi:MAG: radical SAM protein [Methanocellales archaeon]|nr:radical SAM protein [Methanocellales archaeon]MDD3291241.1 radical SAM protein [Methanocellales archaeon]MDD5235413.1 radical SAM protein [Methanocellales archaeon]MDD5484504.1 radical SAM protein [Methanocellales archaeon]
MALDGAWSSEVMNSQSHIFGPVPSRRLGFSLGLDLVPYKTCSFDCVYCQLGRTTNRTTERREYVPKKLIMEELEERLTKGEEIDYITFSGSGEPTLNSKIGEMIRDVRRMTDIPIAVLTNGSLLFDTGVRVDLRGADLVIPSLDAVKQNIFEMVNRPHEGLLIERMVEGLKKFRKEFENEIWLEVMLVQGINDDLGDVKRMADIISEINPDKIQLNTVVRPPCESFALPLDPVKMKEICKMLGEKAEIITSHDRRMQKAYDKETEGEIVTLLKRRPCTIGDISSFLGIHRNEVVKYIEVLEREKRVMERKHGNKSYLVVSEDEMRSV